jgi:hypothetical protein
LILTSSTRTAISLIGNPLQNKWSTPIMTCC